MDGRETASGIDMEMEPRIVYLRPVEMTSAVMQVLEERDLILRLRPGRSQPAAVPGTTEVEPIYESNPAWGPHKLISVTVNRKGLPQFGTHPDNEEVWLIGNPASRPLFLVYALCKREELDKRIREGRVSEKDFIALRAVFNDPEVSFFANLKDTPHGECAPAGPGTSPSFYCTESAGLPLYPSDFQGFDLEVA